MLNSIHTSQRKAESCQNHRKIRPWHARQRPSILPCGFQQGIGRQRRRQSARTFPLTVVTTSVDQVRYFNAIASVPPPTLEISSSSSSIPVPPTFEPVLNVPAFTVFLFIMSIFVFLQWRTRAIDIAAFERNVALRQLRSLKALELSDPTMFNGPNGNNDNNKVQVALEEYQRAYDRVEELRTIVPGVRIVSPPSSNMNRQQQQEHEIAAQQFLGITPLKDEDDENHGTSGTEPNKLKRIHEESHSLTTSPTMVRNVLLAIVAISQIALFLFLIGTDPMMTSSFSSSILDSTRTSTNF